MAKLSTSKKKLAAMKDKTIQTCRGQMLGYQLGSPRKGQLIHLQPRQLKLKKGQALISLRIRRTKNFSRQV